MCTLDCVNYSTGVKIQKCGVQYLQANRLMKRECHMHAMLLDMPRICVFNILYSRFRAKWVFIQGTKCKVGATLHIGYSEDELPLFWEVQKILVLNKCISSVMFVVSDKETLYFNKHFQSYEVIMPANQTTKIVHTRDYSCFLPLNQAKPCRVQTNSKFICYRYDFEA